MNLENHFPLWAGTRSLVERVHCDTCVVVFGSGCAACFCSREADARVKQETPAFRMRSHFKVVRTNPNLHVTEERKCVL